MTITIDLTPDTLSRLNEKAAEEGQDAEIIAARLVAEMLEWEAQDRQEAIEGIRAGLADFEAGRYRSLGEVAAEKRDLHGI